jgi:hypothetical protein
VSSRGASPEIAEEFQPSENMHNGTRGPGARAPRVFTCAWMGEGAGVMETIM